MCDACHTGICAAFDHLVITTPRVQPEPAQGVVAIERQSFVPLTLRTGAYTDDTPGAFRHMAEAAVGIGYSADEFLAELAERSKFHEQVAGWANDRLPNELARKIILTQAEMMIRERGANPTMTLLAA